MVSNLITSWSATPWALSGHGIRSQAIRKIAHECHTPLNVSHTYLFELKGGWGNCKLANYLGSWPLLVMLDQVKAGSLPRKAYDIFYTFSINCLSPEA